MITAMLEAVFYQCLGLTPMIANSIRLCSFHELKVAPLFRLFASMECTGALIK